MTPLGKDCDIEARILEIQFKKTVTEIARHRLVTVLAMNSQFPIALGTFDVIPLRNRFAV